MRIDPTPSVVVGDVTQSGLRAQAGAPKGLRVLLLCNRVPNNPYLFQLIQSLDAHPEVATVQHDTDWLYANGVRFDVAHIQWPEALLGWKEPSETELRRVLRILDEWIAEGTRIAVTVHNELPHGRRTAQFKRLYQSIYDRAHLFLHFGQASIDLLRSWGSFGRARHVIVPHGNYDWHTEGRTVEPPSSVPFKVMSFGQIRSREEIVLLQRAAHALARSGGQLLVAGGLPYSSRRVPRYYATRFPLWRANARIEEGYISNERLVKLMTECHAVFIPRLQNLNSGNVYLAFSFGRVAIGPAVGVIGEELQRTGNVVFQNATEEELCSAMVEARAKVDSGVGEDNLQYATSELSWSRIAELHVSAYRSVLSYPDASSGQ